jgi:DDE superfamily endonuclease
MRRHTSAEFVAFLTDIVIDQPPGKEIHVIADNQSAHKSRPVMEFLAVHPKVHLHFTPTYSSWLNQVELWFSKIERDVIARGVFTSVSDLKALALHPAVQQIAPYHRAISVHNQSVQATSSCFSGYPSCRRCGTYTDPHPFL